MLVGALILPWFVWAHLRYGAFLWQTIFGQHVYTRFTTFLDPSHVEPWYFYPVAVYGRFSDAGAGLLVAAAFVVLVVQTIRRRWGHGLLIVLWFVLPVAAISSGTSKIYHYVFPFLPPLALAAGYAATLLVLLGPAPLARAVARLDRYLAAGRPRIAAALRGRAGRTALMTVAAGAASLAIVSIVVGQVRWEVADGVSLRSSGVLRPTVVAVASALLAGAGRRHSRLVVALLVAGLLPLPGYARSLSLMRERGHPLRSARDCVQRVQAEEGQQLAPGLYVDLPEGRLSHPANYYARAIRPWTRASPADVETPARLIREPRAWRPILTWEDRYRELVHAPAASALHAPHAVVEFADALLVLPGPYAACGREAYAGRR
jgi:hypothetical protein